MKRKKKEKKRIKREKGSENGREIRGNHNKDRKGKIEREK
jgi:hypothetical protein